MQAPAEAYPNMIADLCIDSYAGLSDTPSRHAALSLHLSRFMRFPGQPR